MNTIQINKVLKSEVKTKKIYLGTFSVDQLPKKIIYPSCLIVNNQNSYESGEHWLAIFFHKNKVAEFFDSFGNSPCYYNLGNYLDSHSKRFTFNKTPLQSFTSLYCGLYCIFYLILKAKGRSLNYIINLFKTPYQNDKLFKSLIKKYY